ncbi:MAG: nitroreductase [Solobacterium sp.]|nr:nitroreductase [Solobacterium sp.]
MNDIIQAMKDRRSIRGFKDEMPKKEDLEAIIEAGLYAPSGMGKQSPIIVAVTNREVRDRLSKANCKFGPWDDGFDPFYGAPAVLVVLANTASMTYVNDGSLALGNMMNAAYSLGLGSIWIHRAKEEFEEEEWKAFLKDLGVEGDYAGIGHCAVGYPAGEVPAAAPRNPGRVFWVE